MAHVTLRINGSAFMVGCQDGEESHLLAMAAEVERRIEQFRAKGVQGTDDRMLLLASLRLADELYSVAAQRMPATTVEVLNAADQVLMENELRSEQLVILAEQAESIAEMLENE